ncbi:MAG TPA: hypothetical protein VM912_07825 [Terriglobales bacterium]|nr:hypothetical protein [Terriglobales bacterium]
MSYQSIRPYGRRRTDKPLAEDERLYWETIRREADEDSSGTIRRYLRLASKVLDSDQSKREQLTDRRELFKKRAA